MGTFTRTLVFVGATLFLAMGVYSAVQGNAYAAVGGFIFFLVVAFIGGVGWFFHRFSIPPLPLGAPPPNAFSEAKRFASHHPGWPGRVVKYGLPALSAIGVLTALYGLWIKL